MSALRGGGGGGWEESSRSTAQLLRLSTGFTNLQPQSSSPEPSVLMTVNCVVGTSGKRSSFLFVPKEEG